MGIASLTLGVTSLIGWANPLIGYPICAVGIVLGLISLLNSKNYRKRALTGIGLCLIGLVMTIVIMEIWLN